MSHLRRYRVRVAITAAAALLGFAARGARVSGPQTPTFQSGVEITPVDVTVVDGSGRPVTDLTVADFIAKVDGGARRIVSAQWVPLVPDPKRPKPEPPPE